MHTKAFPYIGLLSLFWGTNIVVSRFGIGEFDPYWFIAIRLSVAVFFFGLIFVIQRQPWPTDRQVWQYASLSGIIGVAIPISLFILSLQYQSSGITSIFVTTGPALMVIVAHFVLPDEKMTQNKAVGVILALSGSLFLVLRGENGLTDTGDASLLGFILITCALCSEVSNTMLVRLRMRDMDIKAVTGIRLLVGASITVVVAFIVSDFSLSDVTVAGYVSVFYSGVIGALAGQFLSFYITGRFGATAFSLTTYLIP
ncbi:MAG: DMT family transporter, partial [Chloroflexota bacterium]